MALRVPASQESPWTPLQPRLDEVARLAQLEKRICELEARLDEIEEASMVATVPITTLAPEPYTLKRPITIALRHQSGAFVASFVEADIHASGGTQQEAFSNARELVLDVFDSLRALPPTKLGPKPRRQLAVLREFLDEAHDH